MRSDDEEQMDTVQVDKVVDGQQGQRDYVEDRAEDTQDARKPKPPARPYTPTKAEVYEHEVTHLPSILWCKHCVHGKGVSAPHHKPDDAEKIGVTVSFDYCFMNGEDDDEKTMLGVLVMWDDNYQSLWAIPVDKKGPQQCVVKWIVDKLDDIGYRGNPLTLK